MSVLECSVQGEAVSRTSLNLNLSGLRSNSVFLRERPTKFLVLYGFSQVVWKTVSMAISTDEDGGPKFGHKADGTLDPKWAWLKGLGYLDCDDPDWDPVFVYAEPELQLLGYTKAHARRLIAEYREKYLYDDDKGRNIKGWSYRTENNIGHEGLMQVAPFLHYVMTLDGPPEEYNQWYHSSGIQKHMQAVADGYAQEWF